MCLKYTAHHNPICNIPRFSSIIARLSLKNVKLWWKRMPVYTYRREDGSTFDIRQSFLDEPLSSCPTTGQAVSRVIQPAGIIFKGSGFYVNDNNKAKNPAKPASANGDEKSASDKEPTAKKTDSKPESKPEGNPEKKAKSRTAATAGA